MILKRTIIAEKVVDRRGFSHQGVDDEAACRARQIKEPDDGRMAGPRKSALK